MNRQIRRRCKCGCGKVTNPGSKYIFNHHIKMRIGDKNSNFKHGLRYHKLYFVMNHMKDRCYNPNNKQYHNYGGRGIRICIRWRRSIKAFHNFSIKKGWHKGLTINRIDNDGNYTADNCNFITKPDNNLNKGMYKNNTSGYNGVCFDRTRGKFLVQINRKFIGYFSSLDKAVKARNQYLQSSKLPERAL